MTGSRYELALVLTNAITFVSGFAVGIWVTWL